MPASSYNRYSRILHWLIAGLIIFMVILGWRLTGHDSRLLSRVNLHKSIGITILLLTCVRIALRLIYKAPPAPPMPKWQHFAANALHFGFYVVMIAMPLSGWAMVSTSVRPIPFFGFSWPHLPVPHSTMTHDVFEWIHANMARVLFFGMLPLHVLAALKHQFVDKDETVEHMVPGLKPRPILNWRWLIPIGVAAAAVILGVSLYRPQVQTSGSAVLSPVPAADVPNAAPTSAPEPADTTASASTESQAEVAEAPHWIVDSKASRLTFATTFSGEPVSGAFTRFTTDIRFDGDHLNQSSVRATIDMMSEASDNTERDESLKSDSFFDPEKFPRAVYQATHFTRKDATHFVAHGRLTLHGVTRPLNLPFTLIIKDKSATMSGTVDLDRLAFGVGSGDWQSTDAIPAKVQVTISIKATQE